MAPSYKMTYFGVRSRGEIPKLVFAAANKPYELVTVEFADWPKVQPQTPFGGLPMLEVDGKKYGQGMAIAVYLAMEFGLMGKTNLDHLQIEQLLHLREDLISSEAKHFLEHDEKIKGELKKKLEDETYPKFLKLFSDALKEKKSKFFLGDKLSLGDLVLYGALTTPLKNFPKLVEKFPDLLTHRKAVAEYNDSIKKHLASVPDVPI